MRLWRWLGAGSVLLAGGVVAVVATVPAGAAVVAPDVFAVTGVGAQGLEVHVMDGASFYGKWKAHYASSAGRLEAARWRYAVGDVNGDGVADLFAVDTQDNGGKNTGVHVYDGKSNYRTTLLNQRLPDLGSTSDAARYRFAAGDFDGDGQADLYVVDARDNGGKNTAVHVLDGAGRLQRYLAHRRLPGLPAVDFDRWQIFAGDGDGDGRADVYVVDGRDAGKYTAVHVTFARSGYTKYEVNRRLPISGVVSSSRWVFSAADVDGDHKSDLVAVDNLDNGGKNMAVHTMSAASAYQKFLFQRRSAIKPLDTARFTTITAWRAAPKASSVGAKIASLARAEEGTPASECDKYHDACNGGQLAWCAMFATWVWEKAGVPGVPRDIFVARALGKWGKEHGLFKARPDGTPGSPAVGDWVIWGKPGTDSGGHVDIVVEVLPDKRLVVVGGNFSHKVTKRTVDPRTDVSGDDNVPISGYVSPPKA
jgi:hypothetical protein